MTRMTVIAMTLGLLAGAACKKKSDPAAGEAAKTQTSTQQKMFKSDDATVISTATCSDDGTTATVGKGA